MISVCSEESKNVKITVRFRFVFEENSGKEMINMTEIEKRVSVLKFLWFDACFQAPFYDRLAWMVDQTVETKLRFQFSIFSGVEWTLPKCIDSLYCFTPKFSLNSHIQSLFTLYILREPCMP